LGIAAVALLIVHGDFPAAGRAGKSPLLIAHENRNPPGSNLLQVCNQAGAIVLPITLVEMLQSRARILTTFKAELDSVVPEELTMSFEKGALLLSRPATFAVACPASSLWEPIDVRHVARTYGAIDAARRDEVGVHSESSIRLVISP
jgi:hypothetical protein